MFYGISKCNRCVLFRWISGSKELKSDGHCDYIPGPQVGVTRDIFSNLIVHWNP
jgi:hypothetical protein